jgi:glycerophosphoryl diester phosphodiesterase
LICGHRGASGYAPENTIAAFRLAMEQGADMCELDVQQTRDDRFAVIHDATLGRTSDGSGPVWKKTLAELQALDAGGWFGRSFAGEGIPSLEQVIHLVRGKMRLHIELKAHGHERQSEELLAAALRRENVANECIVSSFDHDRIDHLKRLAPEIAAGYIFSARQFHDQLFSGAADVLSAHFSLITDDFVKRARSSGKRVHTWTANQTKDMQRLLEAGVDAIITNFPDRLATIVGKGAAALF